MTRSESGVPDYPHVDGLSISVRERVLSLDLNRPESLNSLTAAMLLGIDAVLAQAATDPRVRVVRLGGAGRGFSSGAGISQSDHAAEGRRPGAILEAANEVVQSIVTLPKPVVAVVHGPAAGVGVSLALACDLVLASERAFFLLAFTKIGLMPDGGASALVAAAIGRTRAMRMALLAERMSARDAYEYGLVSGVYSTNEFDEEVDRVLATLASGPALSLRETKQAINAATLTELRPTLERERDGQMQLLKSADYREGVQAFHERRPPTFRGL